ncbi:MAG: aminopeptidase P family protein [Parasporobacterium sp.]|nr:aminopeptidase P family protein [Parasporobacterium sp.]
MNIYTERIEALRKLMKREGMGLYYIPMDDCHSSEYVAANFRCINFMSGFSGSAGQLVVTMDGAWLFADGRYFIQAENQLKGSCIELMKIAEPGVPDLFDFIPQCFNKIFADDAPEKAFGFDGNVVNAKSAIRFRDKFVSITGKVPEFLSGKDLVGEIWTDRPAQAFAPVRNFDIKFSGESTASKLERIRAELKAACKGDNYLYLLNSLDDIAWVFNIRAKDIPCNPVAFGYGAFTATEAVVYLGGEVLPETASMLASQGVTIGTYSRDSLKKDAAGLVVFMDESKIGFDTYCFYKDAGADIRNIKNPSTAMKGVKNKTELENAKNALLRDSARVTEFMYWLKKKSAEAGDGNLMKNDDGTPMSEISVNTYLTGLRAAQKEFTDISFGTIAAYKDNAAMMHYQAKPDNYKEINAEGMLLVDSGAQYEDGTTDITRTFVLGPLTEEEKKCFTLTAVSMLRLLNTVFIDGCSGEILDIMAREPMWKNAMDYKCGTGHGVGHVLNVHEGPHNIRWRIGPDGPTAALKEGMVVTNEPGVYKEGLFGIRTENEMFVKPYASSSDGEFMCFENMTFIPIDLDGIDKKYMTEEDIAYINAYHRSVYEKISDLVNPEIRDWLKEYTREI